MTMAREHQHDTPRHHDTELIAPETHHDPGARFAAGTVPAVQTEVEPGHGVDPTASEMGYEVAALEEDDANTKELKAKVSALVASKFNGDYKKGFDHYDNDKDGSISKSELVQMLEDAGVGNGLTRGAWANGIIKKLDGNGDKKIEWTEFDHVFQGGVQAA